MPESEVSILSVLWDLFGTFHPATVHFPIALLTTSALFVVLRLVFRGVSRDVAFYTLIVGAIAAVPATVMGWSFAAFQGYDAGPFDMSDETLFYHRWIGVAVAVLAGALAIITIRARVKQAMMLGVLWQVGIVGLAALTGYVGYLGGDLAYSGIHERALAPLLKPDTPPKLDNNTGGDGEPSTTPDDGKPTETPGDGAAADPREAYFIATVQPILETWCIECHGPKKQKSDLAMHTRDGAFKGGETVEMFPEEGPSIQPGNAKRSVMYRAITAGEDSDYEIMPPMKTGTLTADQIAAIARWIDDGAVWPDGLELVDKSDQR